VRLNPRKVNSGRRDVCRRFVIFGFRLPDIFAPLFAPKAA